MNELIISLWVSEKLEKTKAKCLEGQIFQAFTEHYVIMNDITQTNVSTVNVQSLNSLKHEKLENKQLIIDKLVCRNK
jgi:hypothetical protein